MNGDSGQHRMPGGCTGPIVRTGEDRPRTGPDHAASPWYGRRALGHREGGEGWTIAHVHTDDVLATGLTMQQLEAITDELERMATETAEQRERAVALQAEVDALLDQLEAMRAEMRGVRATIAAAINTLSPEVPF